MIQQQPDLEWEQFVQSAALIASVSTTSCDLGTSHVELSGQDSPYHESYFLKYGASYRQWYMIFIVIVVIIIGIAVVIHYFLNYNFCFLYLSNSGAANAQLSGCFCPWTFSLYIGLNMLPLDSFMSCLHSLQRYSTGDSTLCNWLSLRRMVPWINRLVHFFGNLD